MFPLKQQQQQTPYAVTAMEDTQKKKKVSTFKGKQAIHTKETDFQKKLNGLSTGVNGMTC